jgi:hypothetical protein
VNGVPLNLALKRRIFQKVPASKEGTSKKETKIE